MSQPAHSNPTRLAPLRGHTLTIGHGTENDFILLTDQEGAVDLDPAVVAAACDRHAGIGADGLMRVVPTTRLTGADAQFATGPSAEPDAAAPQWFMDYRNADGSLAEMCGNGIRVFAAYLRDYGLADLPDGASIDIATRAGPRRVTAVGTDFRVDMGPWGIPGGPGALREGHDTFVDIGALDQTRVGLRVTMPNPHVVVALPTADELGAADLTAATVDPMPADGTNLELIVPGPETTTTDDGVRAGTLAMRVLERGVGETRSCGTGCCAAAVAAATWLGADAPSTWLVTIPGGQVRVDLVDGVAHLTGPAELVADVHLR